VHSLHLAGRSTTGVVEPQVEIDVVAEITAHLAQEMRRESPVAERLRLFWARAESVRDAAPHEKIKKAFLDLAERSGLVSDLGYYGRADVRHVLDWALRGRIPFDRRSRS
jgi:hypothetical protein